MQTTKNLDLTKVIQKKHEGKWVALTPTYDRVIAYSEDLHALTEEVGEQDAVYMKAMYSDRYYAF